MAAILTTGCCEGVSISNIGQCRVICIVPPNVMLLLKNARFSQYGGLSSSTTSLSYSEMSHKPTIVMITGSANNNKIEA